MKEIIKKVYFCDFCNKMYQHKFHAKWHEKHCRENPNNKHVCFQFCDNLYKGQEDISEEDDYSKNITYFQCNVTKKYMYSYIAERRKLPCVTNGEYERMPLICDKFKLKW